MVRIGKKWLIIIKESNKLRIEANNGNYAVKCALKIIKEQYEKETEVNPGIVILKGLKYLII